MARHRGQPELEGLDAQLRTLVDRREAGIEQVIRLLIDIDECTYGVDELLRRRHEVTTVPPDQMT